MMHTPDVSINRIVFTYAGDLWLVHREGGTATRPNSPTGKELCSRFSLDGNSIAYSVNYDGNTDDQGQRFVAFVAVFS